ncbi:unnamed protein product [Bursaphelenchus xylophilus]|uniref:(pine wood nematode) hypothetical protein n=1 Tax=Bursaphelenchus xylophilus TaxID=6326 RepID=A0A7I8WJ71_BURXY|nr:unnamed protein product [Bursaphelenchus xylophilus]CAG9108308.1 unnamed protein product [Bursaphelenchus xylophilus]
MRPCKRDTFDYSKVLNVIVDMRPVNVLEGPIAKQQKKQIAPKPQSVFCVICLDEVTRVAHIKCAECAHPSVIMCIDCFRLGAETGSHRRGHNFQLIHKSGPAVFTYSESEGDEWGVLEDLSLLECLQNNKIHDWPAVAWEEFQKQRTVQEAKRHFDSCFLSSIFGHLALSHIQPSKIHICDFPDADEYTGEFFKPTSNAEIKNEFAKLFAFIPQKQSANKHNVVPKSLAGVKVKKETIENLVCKFTSVHIDHNPPVGNEADDCYLVQSLCKLSEVAQDGKVEADIPVLEKATPKRKKRVTPRKLSNTSLACDDKEKAEPEEDLDDNRYPLRRRESLQSPKKSKGKWDVSPTREVKSERQLSGRRESKKLDRLSISPRKPRSTGRSKSRGRRKLDKPPILTPEVSTGHHATPKRGKPKTEFKVRSILTVSEILKRRMSNPYLNFFTRDIPPLNRQQIRGFDLEDLNLVAFNPRRDDFEHEYRNGAEDFICKIFLNGEQFHDTEVDQLRNAVRVARVHRYNRILERRITNHSICREHQLLSEFLQIVKTNVNERNKYIVINEEAFPSKKRAEECRPFLAKLRRVLTQDELNEFTDDLGEMETLISRIRTLRQLQMSGVTELKGRFKTEYTPGRKRKKAKRNDCDIKKAELRWNRIKKWNKQNKDA